MWEYVTIFGLIFMTWYDNLWMMKFEKSLTKNAKWLVWELMKLHTKIKSDPTTMIKDGYHIDAVYLYVHEKEFIKQYDMLRVFREKVVQPAEKPMIRINGDLDMFEFVKLCRDPETNFNKVDESLYYLLEVNYTFDHKKYRAYYDSKTNRKIRFPIYSEKAIRDRDIFCGGVNSAQIAESEDDEDGINVTKELKRLAGPMQNFYDDTEYVVKKDWFMGDRYKKTDYIQIIDFKGDFHVIKPDDKYLSFTRNVNESS